MVWGRYSAARRKPEADLADLPIAETAQCARCERWTAMPGGELPAGWVHIDGQAFCPDDAPDPAAIRARNSAELEQRQAGRRPRRSGRLSVPGLARSRYHGCRIEHEIQGDAVGFVIRAGEKPPEGRDEAVHFILGAPGIDAWIDHLLRVRGELTTKGNAR